MVERVILVKPRGFCAGVERAIEVVRLALKIYGSPIYVRHAIVHNRWVVKELEGEGAIFVEKIEDIPEGAVTIFSAHGVSPTIREEAKRRKLKVVDATCPLVTKVHLEAKRFAEEGYTIFLIGHKGHVEVEGTMGEAPERIVLIETVEEAKRINVIDPQKVAVLTQTTLSVDDTKEIISTLKKRFPALKLPSKDDICYATQNRQDAVKRLAKEVDVILVIGSKESSNSNRLKEVATKQGVKAFLIEEADGIDPTWLIGVNVVGITAGASTPEYLVEAVVKRLISLGAKKVEEREFVEEKVYFPLPPEILKTPGNPS
jgi:4-hydroxy-3-methylbut-2-enyl diphosphate reductase